MFRPQSLAFGLILASAGLAQAQIVTTTTTTPGPLGGTEVRRVSQLLGSTVHLQGANNYGRVEDIVLGPNGSPAYMVVSNGGRYAALPWTGANINYGQRAINYGVTPQAIQPLQFEQNAWPNFADPAYAGRVTQIFPTGAVVPAGTLVPAGGTVVGPDAAVIEGAGSEKVKIKEKANGTIKEKIKVRP